MKRTIRINEYLPYKPEHVWRALTDATLPGQWFMENDLAPITDRAFTFRMAPQKGWDGVTYCRVIAAEPLKHIAYTYRRSERRKDTGLCGHSLRNSR